LKPNSTQLRDQVSQMADALASLGIRQGDRVATILPNGLPTIVSFIAASIAGTAAPLNPGYRKDEVNFFSRRYRREGPALPARWRGRRAQSG
jgi:acyl-CoA synthetase (AMP-forming)/AMP-acid ligase II